MWFGMNLNTSLAEISYCLTETITETLLVMKCGTSHQTEMLHLQLVKLMQLM